MKRKIQILVILLILLLPLTSLALATELGPGQFHHLQLNRVAAAPIPATLNQSESTLAVLNQVASLFNSEKGLAISDTTSILLLCNQTNPLADDPDYQSELLDNLSVGLKFRF